jgi:transposase
VAIDRRAASHQAVAVPLGLSWNGILGIMERAVERGLERRQTETSPAVGRGTSRHSERQKYFTLVNDPKRSRVL